MLLRDVGGDLGPALGGLGHHPPQHVHQSKRTAQAAGRGRGCRGRIPRGLQLQAQQLALRGVAPTQQGLQPRGLLSLARHLLPRVDDALEPVPRQGHAAADHRPQRRHHRVVGGRGALVQVVHCPAPPLPPLNPGGG